MERPNQIKILDSMLTQARKRKPMNTKQVILMLKEWNRARIILEAESFCKTRIGDWIKQPTCFLDLVKQGQITWEDEPSAVKEYRWLNLN
jgi:hypothetical protein